MHCCIAPFSLPFSQTSILSVLPPTFYCPNTTTLKLKRFLGRFATGGATGGVSWTTGGVVFGIFVGGCRGRCFGQFFAGHSWFLGRSPAPIKTPSVAKAQVGVPVAATMFSTFGRRASFSKIVVTSHGGVFQAFDFLFCFGGGGWAGGWCGGATGGGGGATGGGGGGGGPRRGGWCWMNANNTNKTSNSIGMSTTWAWTNQKAQTAQQQSTITRNKKEIPR